MKTLQIDIVSDVVCPWCAIGFANLNQALGELNEPVDVHIQWHPFQLNPYMAKEGQDINEHLVEKYGLSAQKLNENKQHIQTLAKASGVDIHFEQREYILLTIFNRDFDGDPDNNYFNLLVHLRSGNVVAAPVGLNQQGNSGRSSLTTLGRDYFPPDARWNDTEDLYVVSVDFDELDLMSSGEFVEDPDHEEPVDHHSGVPCPAPIEETDTQENADADTNTGEDTSPTTDAAGTSTTETSDTSSTDNSTQETDTASTDEAGTTDSSVTDETETTETTSNCIEPDSTEASEPTQVTDNTAESATEDTTNATANSADIDSPFTPNMRALDDEVPIPTAIYRMRLGANSTFGLEKISAEDDRPGLGQFIASNSGIIIYRNIDGGDNSYRVLIDHCEGITGRLSTVLILNNTSLIVADDDAGNSSIFEVTERGMNKLIFSCNGNVIRLAYSGYSTSNVCQRVNWQN